MIQYCVGRARKVIENCVLLSPLQGYQEAKRLLAERFGNVFKVTNSWINKVTSGPVIKPFDSEALMDLADDLLNCELTLKATDRLMQINNEESLVKILERCPAFIKVRWQSKVQEFRRQGHRPNIEDVRKLVQAAAAEKNDPVFGRIMERDGKNQPSREKGVRRFGSSSGTAKPRQANFAIQSSDRALESKASERGCFFCKLDHRLDKCTAFQKEDGEKQLELIRARKLCDNCLSTTHFSAGCKRKNACNIPNCSLRRKHLTSLHKVTMANERKRIEPVKPSAPRDDPSSNAEDQFNGVCHRNGAGCIKTGLTLVPVKVKGRGRSNVVETYAILDNGSTASFCSERILRELDINGAKCHMSLATVSKEERYECEMVSLEVMDIDETFLVEIPNVFSTRRLNIPAESITTQEDVDCWPHLTGINVPNCSATNV